jgi:hypothetical protein
MRFEMRRYDKRGEECEGRDEKEEQDKSVVSLCLFHTHKLTHTTSLTHSHTHTHTHTHTQAHTHTPSPHTLSQTHQAFSVLNKRRASPTHTALTHSIQQRPTLN